MNNDAELAIQQKLTKAFIDTQPVDLVLIPRQKIKQPSGGVKWDELEPRDPQTLRLVEPSGAPITVRTADGIERVVDFLLIGEIDAEIGLYDVFDHGGLRWEIGSLYHRNGWEIRAEVARHG